jgi:uncharacterized membrane protein HdeD (DUF308 family)
MAPQTLFSMIGILGIVMGVFSAFWPQRSIRLYQRIMELFNWKVTPIDEARELRNTRFLGAALIILGIAILAIVFLRS